MTCANCVEMLTSFVDGELPAHEAAQIQEHLETCAECAREHRRLVDTSALIKGRLMRYEAPDVLKARIRASIAGGAGDMAIPSRAVPSVWSRRWSRTAAAVVVAAITSSALTVFAIQRNASATTAADDVLASHIRSLMAGHLTDVASTDQHNVKPWFNGRVNVSPDVPRLDSMGYPLAGGRLDYVDGHTAASVIYTRRQHVINVFSWPAPGAPDLASTLSNKNGYHLIRSRQNGVELWIVSDLNIPELKEFDERFESASAQNRR